MAGDWLKMECSTPEKPEVLAITLKLGWDDPDMTVGKLFKLWRWFDQHTEEGNAANVTPALLDRIIGVTGFVEAVESVGWLTINDDGISLPNFDRHTGKTAKTRALTAKRVALHKGNAENVTCALPREEKRREDKTHKSQVGTSQAKPDPVPHEKIIEIYHRCFPVGQKILLARYRGSVREKQLVQRWRESPKHQTLEFWESYFSAAADIPWMTGKTDRGWVADFGYLTKRAGFDKTLELVVEHG